MAETEEWRLCVDWLVRCQIIQADHRVTLASSQVFDLAQVLRDGVLICHLLNGLHVGAIDLKDFSQRPQMSQFLCLKNIRAFLNTCRKVFGLEGVLFDPYDLFEVRDFGKVIKTLSLLSKSPKAKASGIAPFPPNNFVSRQHSDYYNTLEDLATGFRECDPTYVRLPEIAESRDFEDDDVYYDHVTADADEDDIYEDLCAVRRQAALAGEPRSKRDFCIKELEETEKNYVEALDMIITHFVRPLKSCTSADDHKVIFLSIETLQGVHHSFLVELQKATGSVHVKAMHKPSIPDCFIQWKEQFLIYGDFCSNLPRAQERVDDLCNRSEAIREKINECQKKANEGKFRLRDLLSVPMQRVLKYHLLLTELIKQTDREHPDRIALDRALEEMKDLSLYVNEVKRDNEALQLINEIQNSITDLQMPDNTSLKDYGKLLKDGELKIKSHDDNRARNRYIFLFDKVMLMCKSRGETYGYKNALILSQYRVEQMARPTGDRAWSFAFLLVEKNSQSAYTIQAKTDDMKKKWIDAIEMAHDNTAPKGAREGSHEFIMFSFVEPTICDVCRKLLRGVFYQGYKCQSTNMAVHKECIMKAKNLLGPPTRPERVTFPQPSRPRNREVISHVKARAPNDGSMGPQHNRSVLKFQEGAVIQLLNKDDPNWWEGRLNGIEGFFPSALVEEKTRPLLRRPSYTAPLPGALSQQPSPQPAERRRTSYEQRSSSSTLLLHTTPELLRNRSKSVDPSTLTSMLNNAHNCQQLVSETSEQLKQLPWFVGEMRRDVATVRLEPTIDSTFLVRESCNPQCKGEYALSIKFGSTVKHIRVFRSPDRMFFLADCKMFRSVPELVQYYRENTLQNSFPELQTTLMYPFRDAAAAAAAQPKPAAAQGISMCTVQYDYTANQLNQLTLEVGDRVTIISKAGGERGWWKGSLNGKIGYFPSAYVEED